MSQPEPAVTDTQGPTAPCVFCGVSPEKGFDIVFEDQDYVAFKDRRPAAEHHLLLIPKKHVGNVKSLSQSDIPMLTTMKEIGTRILDDLNIPVERRRMGFHVPPFNMIGHLHLHILALPYRGIGKWGFPVSEGKNGKSKGFSWFVEVDQATEILQREKTIGVFSC